MKYIAAVSATLAMASLLTGCASLPAPDSTEFTAAGRSYQYQASQSTMLFANAMPLEVGQGDEATRVLALFGMPDFDLMKPGVFSNEKFASSSPQTTQWYISPALNTKPDAAGLTNTDLAAVSTNVLSTTGMSAGAAGGAGAALLIAGADLTPDPRTTYGSAICYRPVAEQPDFNKAYVECVDQVVEDVKKALGPNAVMGEKSDLFTISGSVDVPSYGKQPVSLLVTHRYNHAATGYAPADKGGFKANIFSIQVKRFGDVAGSKATVDDIGRALRSVKRPTISYRINASEDFRKQKNAEPVGVY